MSRKFNATYIVDGTVDSNQLSTAVNNRINNASSSANTGANTVRVSQNSASTLSAKQLNFVNTATVTIAVTDSGDGNANIAFTSAGGGGGGTSNSNVVSIYATGGLAPIYFYTGATIYSDIYSGGSGSIPLSGAADLSLNARQSGGWIIFGTQNVHRAWLTNLGFNIAGALTKGSGSFRISHPHPSKANTHNLVHSFIEGPQVDLIYRGKVQLENGRATVNIDQNSRMTEGTFELLCREVQCFTSNESDWDAVRGSVTGNILTIECQNPASTASVSWMVIGERKDQHIMDTGWTDENGKIIMEPEKTRLEL